MFKQKMMIIFFVVVRIAFGSETSFNHSEIGINVISAIIITPSTTHLEFGEELIESGKTIYPKDPIILKIEGQSEIATIVVKVEREVVLRNKMGDEITNISSLESPVGQNEGDGQDVILVIESPELPLEVYFSGSIFLTGLESPGSYEDNTVIIVEYR